MTFLKVSASLFPMFVGGKEKNGREGCPKFAQFSISNLWRNRIYGASWVRLAIMPVVNRGKWHRFSWHPSAEFSSTSSKPLFCLCRIKILFWASIGWWTFILSPRNQDSERCLNTIENTTWWGSLNVFVFSTNLLLLLSVLPFFLHSLLDGQRFFKSLFKSTIH